MSEFELETWTLYDHPADIPDEYVARMFRGLTATEATITSTDVESIRTSLAQMGLTKVPRHELDHPNIMETWI